MISFYVELRKTKDKQSSEIQRTGGDCQRQELGGGQKVKESKVTNLMIYNLVVLLSQF